MKSYKLLVLNNELNQSNDSMLDIPAIAAVVLVLVHFGAVLLSFY